MFHKEIRKREKGKDVNNDAGAVRENMSKLIKVSSGILKLGGIENRQSSSGNTGFILHRREKVRVVDEVVRGEEERKKEGKEKINKSGEKERDYSGRFKREEEGEKEGKAKENGGNFRGNTDSRRENGKK